MIRKISEKIAEILVREQVIKVQDLELYVYGLELLLAESVCMVSVMGIGLLAGRFLHTVVYYLSYIVIRIYAGGYHADSHRSCTVIFSVCYLILMFFVEWTIFLNLTDIWLFGVVFADGVILILAPVEDHRKPLKESEYQIFRKKVRKNLLLYSLTVIILYKSRVSVRCEILYGMAAICEIAVLLLAGCVKNRYHSRQEHRKRVAEAEYDCGGSV